LDELKNAPVYLNTFFVRRLYESLRFGRPAHGSQAHGNGIHAIVILFFFGAKRIPEMAKGVADGIKTFKKSMKDDDDEKGNTK